MEASIEGIQAIASSFYIPEHMGKAIDFFDPKNYSLLDDAAAITLKITKLFIEEKPDKGIDVLSINIPYGATVNSEIVITYPHREPYGQLFHRQDNMISHKSPALDFTNMKEGTDLKAISDGKISITPLNLDLVSKESMENLELLLKRNW